jgi:capsular polysaccharide biosynthesis protein
MEVLIVEDSFFLEEIIKTVKKYFWVILLITILGGIAGRVLSSNGPTPTYEASSLIILEQKHNESNGVINPNGDSARFYNTAQTLFNTPVILKPVIKDLNLEKSLKELSSQISVSNENSSQLLRVTVTDSNAQQATDIANSIVNVYQQEISNYLDVETVKIIEMAQSGQENQIVHNRSKANMAMGVLIGFILGSLLAYILRVFSNRKKVRN